MDKNVESENVNIKVLANKYNMPEDEMEYLIKKYGSIDKLYSVYNSNRMYWKDVGIAEKIIRRTVDIDGRTNEGYELLYRFIRSSSSSRMSEEFRLFSSKQLDKIIDGLSDTEKKVIDERFGLTSGEGKFLKDVGVAIGISTSYARNIEVKAAAKIRRAYNDDYNFWGTSDYLTGRFKKMSLAERRKVEEIKKDIQLQNGTLQENLAKLNSIRSRYDHRARARANLSSNTSAQITSEADAHLNNQVKQAGLETIEQPKNIATRAELTERILAKQKTVEQQQQEISQFNKKDIDKN